MTQDEIIRMAREAGLICESRPVTAWMESTDLTPYLTRFAALVAQNYMTKACGGCTIKQCYKRMDAEIEAAVLAEREACAKVCEELQTVNPAWVDMNYAEQCAAAIRARGNDASS